MANRTANYTAFYVKEPFSESNLGANATPDFLYYNQLCAWKGADSSFPFVICGLFELWTEISKLWFIL